MTRDRFYEVLIGFYKQILITVVLFTLGAVFIKFVTPEPITKTLTVYKDCIPTVEVTKTFTIKPLVTKTFKVKHEYPKIDGRGIFINDMMEK